MNTKYIKHLKSFILSLNFTVLLGILLGITIFMLYAIYFEPVSLCDDTSPLNVLKDKLDDEISQFEENLLNIEAKNHQISGLDFNTSKNTNGGFIHRKVYLNHLENLFENKRIHLKNIQV
jgi:hypothetical protein